MLRTGGTAKSMHRITTENMATATGEMVTAVEETITVGEVMMTEETIEVTAEGKIKDTVGTELS